MTPPRIAGRAAALALAAGLLAGCLTGRGGTEEQQPEIGDGPDDYKRSPCACVEVPQRYPEGWDAWMRGEA